MSSNQLKRSTKPVDGQDKPWYRQFWPWFIIALPASAVIASFVSLWLAISNPDPLVVTEEDYQQLSSELKAQTNTQDKQEADAGVVDPELN
jgi:hypothetical protein